jgi:hypothetical protein
LLAVHIWQRHTCLAQQQPVQALVRRLEQVLLVQQALAALGLPLVEVLD